jgi:hypothetical protein
MILRLVHYMNKNQKLAQNNIVTNKIEVLVQNGTMYN